jgi:hypothetical protein
VVLLGGTSRAPLQGAVIAVSPRLQWAPILARASEAVRSYDTSVTLRQLFYRLVSQLPLPNTDPSYKTLSAKTAELRRAGEFPDLIDRGRSIHRQLESWFGDLGAPILALSGYSSQSYVNEVLVDVPSDRPAVLLYAGDFDPSGEDIDRDFVTRTDCWDKVIRVALSAEQVTQYQLPPNPGKVTDSRAAGFVARRGELVQVEIDALPPETLRALFADEIAEYWDESAYAAVLEREDAERELLRTVAAVIEGQRW